MDFGFARLVAIPSRTAEGNEDSESNSSPGWSGWPDRLRSRTPNQTRYAAPVSLIDQNNQGKVVTSTLNPNKAMAAQSALTIAMPNTMATASYREDEIAR